MLGNIDAYERIAAKVENVKFLGPEASLFEAGPEAAREINVYVASVQVDDRHFENILFGDNGGELVCLYGFGIEREFVAAWQPQQAALLDYLDERTEQNRQAFGLLANAFTDSHLAGVNAVIKAYAIVRGISTEDSWEGVAGPL